MRIEDILKRCARLSSLFLPVGMLAHSAGIPLPQLSGPSAVPAAAPLIRLRTFGEIADSPGFSDLTNWVIPLIIVSMLMIYLILRFLEEIAADALRKKGQK